MAIGNRGHRHKGGHIPQARLYLTHHNDPYEQVTKLAQEIKASPPKAYGSISPAIDQYLLGKVARTERIVALLEEENRRCNESYMLRVQAAFSCFAISDDPGYRVGGYHSPEYHALLVRELEGVSRMIRTSSLRAILWPQRPHDDRFIGIRFKNLVKFLETNPDFKRIRFVLGKYHGGNLYIFNSIVLAQGFKSPNTRTPGYEITTFSYHGPTVSSATESLDKRFNKLWMDHTDACDVDTRNGSEEIRSYVITELKRMGGLM